MNYYNEWDKGAAAWLRELINAGHIPPGIVDERSITEVRKEDLTGFTQCHFFCGIGGWPLALLLAGVSATVPLWSGSPPCQPFSVAGKQLGKADPRHLAPAFLELIAQCRPQRLYGEQVAAAIGKHWLDALLIELEEQGYTCGAAVLPACSVGAPHKRDRLFFGAALMDHASSIGRHARRHRDNNGHDGQQPAAAGKNGSMADTDSERLQREWANRNSQGREGPDVRQAGLCDGAGFSTMDDSDNQHQCATRYKAGPGIARRASETLTPAPPHHGFWSDSDWLGCRDGKFRPVEPGTFPLANGIPARVGRLRGYGNAIVPQVAAEFIKAFNGAIDDQKEKAFTKN